MDTPLLYRAFTIRGFKIGSTETVQVFIFFLTLIFLFVCKQQQGICAKLDDCQDSSSNTKWSF